MKSALLSIVMAVTLSVSLSSGATWTSVTGPMASYNLWAVAAVPGRDRVIATCGNNYDGHVFYATSDGGTTWTQLGQGAGSDNLDCQPYSILFDPAQPDTFWIFGNFAGSTGGLFKTTDGGNTIHTCNANVEVEDLSVDFKNPARKTLVAGRHDNSQAVYKSTDGGSTWTNIGTTLPSTSGYSCYPLIIDSVTYLIGCGNQRNGSSKGTAGIWRTTDGGATWTNQSSQSPFSHPLVVNDTIYWSCSNGGIIRSVDKGITWTTVTVNGMIACTPVLLPGAKIAAITTGRYVTTSTGATAPWTNQNPIINLTSPAGLTYNTVRQSFFAWQIGGGVSRLDFTVEALKPASIHPANGMRTDAFFMTRYSENAAAGFHIFDLSGRSFDRQAATCSALRDGSLPLVAVPAR